MLNLNKLIKLKLTTVTKVQNPNITPSIKGIVFIIPWLNPEWKPTILFGPGEQLATNINKDKDKTSGCIFMLSGNHFQIF